MIPMIVLIVFAIVYFGEFGKEAPGDYIGVSGVIEATEVELASKVPGRIVWLCCSEGESVKNGEVAFRLDGRELEAKLEKGKAAVKLSEASLAMAEWEFKNAGLQVEAAKDELAAQQSETERLRAFTGDAKKNLERAIELFRGGNIPRKQLDDAQTTYDTRKASFDAAQARIKMLETKVRSAEVNRSMTRAKVLFARAQRSESKAGVAVLEAQLADTSIISPINGVVVYRFFETGETLTPGAPVYTVHDLDDVWALLEIEETDIGRIRLGAGATVSAVSLPGRIFRGTVTEIGRVGEFATQRDVLRGIQDIRTFRVKVGIKEPQGLLKSGMTVHVKIYPGKDG